MLPLFLSLSRSSKSLPFVFFPRILVNKDAIQEGDENNNNNNNNTIVTRR